MCCTHQHRTAAHANTLHKLIFLVINMLISLQGPWWQSDSWGGSSSSKFSQRHHRDRRCPRAYKQSFQRQGCLHSTLLSIILVKRICHIFCSAISLSLLFFVPCRGEYPCGRHCEAGITNRGKQWTWRSATMMWTAGTFLAVRTQRSIHFRGNWPSELKAVSLVDLNFKRQDGHFLFRLAGAEKVVQ